MSFFQCHSSHCCAMDSFICDRLLVFRPGLLGDLIADIIASVVTSGGACSFSHSAASCWAIIMGLWLGAMRHALSDVFAREAMKWAP